MEDPVKFVHKDQEYLVLEPLNDWRPKKGTLLAMRERHHDGPDHCPSFTDQWCKVEYVTFTLKGAAFASVRKNCGW